MSDVVHSVFGELYYAHERGDRVTFFESGKDGEVLFEVPKCIASTNEQRKAAILLYEHGHAVGVAAGRTAVGLEMKRIFGIK